MEIREFKKRLQTISGQSLSKDRAIDIIAEACEKISALKLDACDAGIVLTEAARLLVEEIDPRNFLGFLEMEAAVATRCRALYDDPQARRVSGIPDPS